MRVRIQKASSAANMENLALQPWAFGTSKLTLPLRYILQKFYYHLRESEKKMGDTYWRLVIKKSFGIHRQYMVNVDSPHLDHLVTKSCN
jgi:hypothetical protein